MLQTNDVMEPNFEGEEMKMPVGAIETPIEGSGTRVLTGPIIILLFLILAAILGGLYYWYSIVISTSTIQAPVLTRPTTTQNQEPETTTATAQAQSADVVSTSDNLDAIEADAQSTDLNSIDTDLTTIDTNVSAALDASTTTQ